MQLPQTCHYALRAMAVLANLRAGEALRSADLAPLAGIPAHYLSKVMRQLVVAGLVESRKGHHGGFRLAKPATSIRLADVLAVVDAYPPREQCAFGWGRCDAAHPCPLHDVWSEIQEEYCRWAEDTTLDRVGTATHLPFSERDIAEKVGVPAARVRRRSPRRSSRKRG